MEDKTPSVLSNATSGRRPIRPEVRERASRKWLGLLVRYRDTLVGADVLAGELRPDTDDAQRDWWADLPGSNGVVALRRALANPLFLNPLRRIMADDMHPRGRIIHLPELEATGWKAAEI